MELDMCHRSRGWVGDARALAVTQPWAKRCNRRAIVRAHSQPIAPIFLETSVLDAASSTSRTTFIQLPTCLCALFSAESLAVFISSALIGAWASEFSEDSASLPCWIRTQKDPVVTEAHSESVSALTWSTKKCWTGSIAIVSDPFSPS